MHEPGMKGVLKRKLILVLKNKVSRKKKTKHINQLKNQQQYFKKIKKPK
jgi:hypothetical protein